MTRVRLLLALACVPALLDAPARAAGDPRLAEQYGLTQLRVPQAWATTQGATGSPPRQPNPAAHPPGSRVVIFKEGGRPAPSHRGPLV